MQLKVYPINSPSGFILNKWFPDAISPKRHGLHHFVHSCAIKFPSGCVNKKMQKRSRECGTKLQSLPLIGVIFLQTKML